MAVAHEKRREKRDVFTVTIEYAYSSVTEGKLTRKTGAAVTSNLSKGGMSIYTNQVFNTGQNVTVYSRQIDDDPLNTMVRWCNQISDSIYKVGLMFS